MSKEAIAIVLDVCCNSHYDQTAFENAVHCASKLLIRKILSESRDRVCLVVAGENGIELAIELTDLKWTLVDSLRDLKPVISSHNAGVFEAIKVALEHLQETASGRRDTTTCSIAVFSHAQHTVNENDRSTIDQLSNVLNDIQFAVSWIHPEKTANVTVSTFLNSLTNGCALTQEDVIGIVKKYQTRQPRATAWKAQLEFGIAANRKSVHIPVCGYLKIREAKQKSMQVVLASNPDILVKSERTFFKPDAAAAASGTTDDGAVKYEDDEARETAAAGGNTEHGKVSAEDIEFAHRFGRDLVVISDAEYKNMRYRVTSKCLQVLKIVPRCNVPLSYLSGDAGSMLLVGDPASSEAQRAISALVGALDEADACCIVRKCYNAASMPRLFVLLPKRSRKLDKLICIGLPFGDDIRSFHFESLPLDETILRDKPYLRRLAPTAEQRKVVDDLVSASLSYTKENEAVLDFNNLQNPFLQRFLDTCDSKACRLPCSDSTRLQDRTKDEALLDGGVNNGAWRAMLECSAEFVQLNSELMARVHDAFELKRIAKADAREKPTGYSMFLGRADAEQRGASQSQDLGNAGADVEMVDDGTLQVGSVSAVRDFLKLARAERDELIIKGFAAMRGRVEEFLADEFAQPYFPKIVECLVVLRSESIHANVDFEQPRMYNEFLLRLKQRVIESPALREFWQLARDSKVAMITQSDASVTAYPLASDEEAAKLYDVLDSEVTMDEAAAAKLRQIEMEDDFDPFAEVRWNC